MQRVRRGMLGADEIFCLDCGANYTTICAVLCLVTQSCLTFCNPMDCSPPGSSVHGDSPGKNTGVGCHALLQEIFPIQELSPGLPHCRRIFYHLSHQGSPRILKWVACSFSRESSQPRNQTGVSYTAGGFFTAELPGKPSASVFAEYRLSCSAACGIFPDQGSSQCPLHWQVDS